MKNIPNLQKNESAKVDILSYVSNIFQFLIICIPNITFTPLGHCSLEDCNMYPFFSDLDKIIMESMTQREKDVLEESFALYDTVGDSKIEIGL